MRLNSIKSVEKALQVLEQLINMGGETCFTDLAAELSIPPSTLHRLLSSLRTMGFVRQEDKGSEYRVGDKFISLALSTLGQMDLRTAAYPYLEELMEKTGETANLVILSSDKKEVIYVQQVKSKATVSGLSLIGSRAPVYATGVGKVLLAGLGWSQAAQILKDSKLKQLTENTITTLSKWKKELEEVMEQGFAIDREECEKGAACIAAPITNDAEETVAAVSISGPAGRILDGSLEKLTQITKEQAQKLSCAIGELTQFHTLSGGKK